RRDRLDPITPSRISASGFRGAEGYQSERRANRDAARPAIRRPLARQPGVQLGWECVVLAPCAVNLRTLAGPQARPEKTPLFRRSRRKRIRGKARTTLERLNGLHREQALSPRATMECRRERFPCQNQFHFRT